MEVSLHQGFGLVVHGEFNRLGCGRMAVLGDDNLERCNVNPCFCGGRTDLCLWADEHGNDEFGLGCLDRPKERNLVDRVHDRGPDRWQALGFLTRF
jgi:hypothetical protein